MKRVGWLVLWAMAACAMPPAAPAPRGEPSLACPAWSMEGGGPGRPSRTAIEAPGRWDVARITEMLPLTGYVPEEYATPLLRGPFAYVGHSGRSFQAVRWKDGQVEWKFPTRGRVYTTAACSNGLLIFGDDEGDVRALSFEGKEIWKFHLSYPVVASPVAAAGKVYVAEADQNVFCLEASTGRPLWQYGRKFPQRNSIWRSLGFAWGENRLYAGFSDGTLVALDADVGRVEWRVELARGGLFADVVAGPSFDAGRIYAGSAKGPVLCLEAATGKELWRQDVEAVSGFAVGPDLVYLGTAAGTVTALSKANGSKAWEVSLDGGVPTAPVLAGDKVLVGASDGSLHSIDAQSGRVLDRYAPGPGLHAQPLVFEGGVLFLSDGAALHHLK